MTDELAGISGPLVLEPQNLTAGADAVGDMTGILEDLMLQTAQQTADLDIQAELQKASQDPKVVAEAGRLENKRNFDQLLQFSEEAVQRPNELEGDPLFTISSVIKGLALAVSPMVPGLGLALLGASGAMNKLNPAVARQRKRDQHTAIIMQNISGGSTDIANLVTSSVIEGQAAETAAKREEVSRVANLKGNILKDLFGSITRSSEFEQQTQFQLGAQKELQAQEAGFTQERDTRLAELGEEHTEKVAELEAKQAEATRTGNKEVSRELAEQKAELDSGLIEAQGEANIEFAEKQKQLQSELGEEVSKREQTFTLERDIAEQKRKVIILEKSGELNKELAELNISAQNDAQSQQFVHELRKITVEAQQRTLSTQQAQEWQKTENELDRVFQKNLQDGSPEDRAATEQIMFGFLENTIPEQIENADITTVSQLDKAIAEEVVRQVNITPGLMVSPTMMAKFQERYRERVAADELTLRGPVDRTGGALGAFFEGAIPGPAGVEGTGEAFKRFFLGVPTEEADTAESNAITPGQETATPLPAPVRKPAPDRRRSRTSVK